MKDLLQEATRALREETAPESSATTRRRDRQTRARIQDDLRLPPSRTRSGFFAVPLAAILIGSTAWASGALPRIVDAWTKTGDERQPPVSPAKRRVAPPPAPVAPVPVREAPAQPEAEPPEEVVEPDAVAVPTPVAPPTEVVAAPTAKAPIAHTRPAPRPQPDAVQNDRSTALYRAAHQAHFGGGGPAAALRHWNAYLAEAPGGRFAPEAAFNRAICLVRLGQHQAAIAALTPFSAGSFGGYRQSEAKQLISALQKKR